MIIILFMSLIKVINFMYVFYASNYAHYKKNITVSKGKRDSGVKQQVSVRVQGSGSGGGGYSGGRERTGYGNRTWSGMETSMERTGGGEEADTTCKKRAL